MKRYLPQIVVLLSLLGLYLSTLAPGLTWANGGSDGGDLITAAATGGVAHPSGYPLYLILARLFQALPLGELAFRTNLMSAVFTSLAAVLIFEIVTRSVSGEIRQPWFVGLTSAYAFGLAPLIWSQAVITEVYGLQSFLIVLIIYLYTLPAARYGYQTHRLDTWRGLTLGLAVSNHVTAVLIIPIALLSGSIGRKATTADDSRTIYSSIKNLKLDFPALGRQCLGLVIGLAPYTILPLRALTHPAVNWGNPVTLQNFWWLVSGRLYQSYYFQALPVSVGGRVQAAAALLFEQFGFVVVLIGVLGLVLFDSKSRLYTLTLWIAVTEAAFAGYYNADDSYLYLIPAFGCFAIWVGWGIAGLIQPVTEQAFLRRLLLQIVILAYVVLRALTATQEVAASHDLRAETFGTSILGSAPQNAIIFAEGDRAVFTLWYFHFALHERPDLAILAVDLLHFGWYQENIHATYPTLKIDGPYPWPETISRSNPARPVCYVQFTNKTMMKCFASRYLGRRVRSNGTTKSLLLNASMQ